MNQGSGAIASSSSAYRDTGTRVRQRVIQQTDQALEQKVLSLARSVMDGNRPSLDSLAKTLADVGVQRVDFDGERRASFEKMVVVIANKLVAELRRHDPEDPIRDPWLNNGKPISDRTLVNRLHRELLGRGLVDASGALIL